MEWNSIILAMIAFVILVLAWKRITKGRFKNLPPGPRGFPIFGCLHLLGKSPHRDLHRLAQKYGSIMYMRFGLVPTVVVSSPQAAELILKTHDLVFASRPPNQAAIHMAYEQKSLTFAPYGSYWRNIRKMCTLELLSTSKISSFRSMRKEELDLFITEIKRAANKHAEVDLSAKVLSASADMSCRMIFGKKYGDKEFNERGFKAVIQEGMQVAATPNLGDYIPQIATLDLQGLTKRMKATAKVYDKFLEKAIDDHTQSKEKNGAADFIDVMLRFVGSEETEYRIGRDNTKSIILDMLVASMDTSATTIEWALSEIMKHPQVMKKVQTELEEKIGKNRMVEEADLDKLQYLDMVIKETFRLHPVVPLLLPHQSMEDCTINGFFIPRRSLVLINAWAIVRDPNDWKDEDKFLPERFIGSSIDVRGRDFQLIPFGSGRRSCPGMHLALTMVRLVLAQLLHCFDWELPDGMQPNELDMDEVCGIVTSRAHHLIAIPTYRLQV